jgi:exodeoxyribonuclease-1
MVCQIRDKLQEWCPTTFVGWNSINYDEHLLRQAFYKCLHPPYLTNTNGNQRSDMMKLAQCVEAYAKDVLVVPINEKGKPSYKLDQLAPANGFNHAKAHDAMGDVEATLFLCRLIKERAPAAWERMLHCAAKARVETVVNENAIFVLHDYYGSLKEYPLTRLGDEPNGFAVLAYDLSVAPDQLIVLNDAQLSARLGKSPRLVRRIRSNVGPLVTPALEGQAVAGVAYGELVARRNFLVANAALVQRIIQASARDVAEPSPHVEEQIYDGFPSPADSARMVQFHATQWCDRFDIVEQFQDARLRAIGRRLVHAHCPESLPAHVKAEEDKLLAARIIGHGIGAPPWSTLDAVDQEAALMEQEGHEHLAEMLKEFRAFIAGRKQQAMATLGLA